MAQAAVRLRLLLLCLGRVALGADVNVSSVDLSAHHGRLTRAFDVAPTRLSADQLARFREDGYVARVPLLDRAGVAALSAEIDALTTAHANDSRWHEFHANEGTDDARLCHGLGHWRIGALSHDLVFHPTVAAIAAQLLPGGAGPRLFHDQAFIKPSARGGPVSYHQDYSYWTRTKPMRHLTFHVALDDCDDERIGGLELVAGSHRWRDAPLPITDPTSATSRRSGGSSPPTSGGGSSPSPRGCAPASWPCSTRSRSTARSPTPRAGRAAPSS